MTSGFAQTNETPFAVVEARIDLPIPDAKTEGVTHTIYLPGSAVVEELQVAVRIDHPSVEQLSVSLTDPNGLSVLLHNRTSSSVNPFTAIYESQAEAAESLSKLIGRNGGGDWELRVSDLVNGETGILIAWGLKISPVSLMNPPNPTPVPFHEDQFFELSRLNPEIEVSAIDSADMNNDGWDDLVLLSEVDHTVTVYFSDGEGGFSQPLAFEIDRPMFFTDADINGDSWPDFVVSSQDAQFAISDIVVYLGNASGGFQESFSSKISTALDHLFVFDGNGDGKTDILVGGTPHILEGIGDGSFAPARLFVRDGHSYLAHSDLNRDGQEDLLVRISRGGTSPNSDPYVLFGSGDPTYPDRKKIELKGLLLQSFAAKLQSFNRNEMVVISDTNEPGSTLWFYTLYGNGESDLHVESMRLAAELLNIPLEHFDLNGDGIEELFFPTEAGIHSFQLTDDPLGGRSTRLFTILAAERVKAGHFFSAGDAGLAVLTSTNEIIIARSTQEPMATPTPTLPPLPTPTPFLFVTPVSPEQTPTPILTPTPTLFRTPDLNGDGVVDRMDLLILMENWGKQLP